MWLGFISSVGRNSLETQIEKSGSIHWPCWHLKMLQWCQAYPCTDCVSGSVILADIIRSFIIHHSWVMYQVTLREGFYLFIFFVDAVAIIKRQDGVKSDKDNTKSLLQVQHPVCSSDILHWTFLGGACNLHTSSVRTSLYVQADP